MTESKCNICHSEIAKHFMVDHSPFKGAPGVVFALYGVCPSCLPPGQKWLSKEEVDNMRIVNRVMVS
jgi:hypothetical protein